MRKTVLMPIAAIFALLVGSACKRDPVKATVGETIQDAYNVNYTMEFDAAHSVEDRKLLIDAKVDEIHKNFRRASPPSNSSIFRAAIRRQ